MNGFGALCQELLESLDELKTMTKDQMNQPSNQSEQYSHYQYVSQKAKSSVTKVVELFTIQLERFSVPNRAELDNISTNLVQDVDTIIQLVATQQSRDEKTISVKKSVEILSEGWGRLSIDKKRSVLNIVKHSVAATEAGSSEVAKKTEEDIMPGIDLKGEVLNELILLAKERQDVDNNNKSSGLSLPKLSRPKSTGSISKDKISQKRTLFATMKSREQKSLTSFMSEVNSSPSSPSPSTPSTVIISNPPSSLPPSTPLPPTPTHKKSENELKIRTETPPSISTRRRTSSPSTPSIKLINNSNNNSTNNSFVPSVSSNPTLQIPRSIFSHIKSDSNSSKPKLTSPNVSSSSLSLSENSISTSSSSSSFSVQNIGSGTVNFDDCVNNLLKLIESFAPNDWSKAVQPSKDKLATDIAAHIAEYSGMPLNSIHFPTSGSTYISDTLPRSRKNSSNMGPPLPSSPPPTSTMTTTTTTSSSSSSSSVSQSIASVHTNNANISLNAKKKKKTVSLSKSSFSVIDFTSVKDSTPRVSLGNSLIDTVLKLNQNIIVVVDGYDSSVFNPSIPGNDVRDSISETINKLNEILSNFEVIFPSVFQSDSAHNVWKRTMEDVAKPHTPKTLPYDSEFVETGQHYKLFKKEILDAVISLLHTISHNSTNILTFLRHLQADSLGVRVAIFTMIHSFKMSFNEILNLFETLYHFEKDVVTNIKRNSLTSNINDSIMAMSALAASSTSSVTGGSVQRIQRLSGNYGQRKHRIAPATTSNWNKAVDQVGESIHNSHDLFRPGTANNFLMRLTSVAFDKTLFRTFLVGFSRFSKIEDTINKLIQRYRAPNVPECGQTPQMVKRLVLNIILQWLKHDYYSMSDNVLSMIKTFVTEELIQDKLNDIGKSIENHLVDNGRFELREHKFPPMIPVYQIDDLSVQPHQLLMFADELEIAEQMTCHDMEIYLRISYRELMDLKWTKDESKYLSPNVVALMSRANQISFWIASVLLLQQKVADRTKMLSKIINLARYLADLKNYNSLMGVLTGLNMASISRLKFTFNALSKKSTEELKRMNQFQEPSGGFKYLRTMMKMNGATIPYLGLYLKDLMLMDENSNYITVSNIELINWSKYQLVATSIFDFLSYQKNGRTMFTLTKEDPIFSLLYDLPVLSEKELWQMSMEREPRNATSKEIE
eukprot:TRINITY_DN1215_c0_g1_i1.p1 TRINITY_DN1215_c0_g1~~TRINITY_DN1215_c0_g1_i1.p1  ORF type:complete len:1173 (-),score=256.14 TRINITY_DN1215_c0_g1_i1:206-3724(-)